jgi:long-chain fatty acid transport protein
VHSINDDVKAGVGFAGNFGLAEDWGGDWAGRYYAERVELVGATFTPSLAWQVNDQLSLGITLNAMYAMLDAKVAINNLLPSEADGALRYDDTDWGFGTTFGVLYEVDSDTRLGFTYTSENQLDFNANPEFSGLGPGLDAVLDVTGAKSAELKLDMTVPQALMTSAYHQLNSRWAILGNLGWQQWSEFGYVDVSLNTINQRELTTESHYDDTWHAALGTEYRYSDQWLLTTGLAYDTSMVSDSNRTLTLPMDSSWSLGFGAQYQLRQDFHIGLGYELKWFGDVSVDQDRGPLAGRVSGKYNNMALHFFAVNFNWAY